LSDEDWSEDEDWFEDEEEGPYFKRFPEEHDTAALVRDNGYIMSYFSGIELSVLDTDKKSECYPLWQTEMFPIGL
jgi:hypothetical protein